MERLREAGDPKLLKVEAVVEELKEFARGALAAHGVWRFFPARSEGNRLVLLEPGKTGEKVAAEWLLPRQAREDGLCLADYVLPQGRPCRPVRRHRRRRRARDGGAVQARRRVPEEPRLRGLGAGDRRSGRRVAPPAAARPPSAFPDPPEMTTRERLAAKYRGNALLLRLSGLPGPSPASVSSSRRSSPPTSAWKLTEGDMMDPEATRSRRSCSTTPTRGYFGV